MSFHYYNKDEKVDIQHNKMKSLLHAPFYRMSTLLPDILILPLTQLLKRLTRKIFVTAIYDLFRGLEHSFDLMKLKSGLLFLHEHYRQSPFLFNFTNEHVVKTWLLGIQILPFLGRKDNRSLQTVETTRTTTLHTHFLFHNFARRNLQESNMHS